MKFSRSRLPSPDDAIEFMRAAMFEATARRRLARGLHQLSRGRVIVTDRLHVYILSVLLGRPHAVLDNSYGRIARFMSAFSGTTALTYRAHGMDDAIAWACEQAGQH